MLLKLVALLWLLSGAIMAAFPKLAIRRLQRKGLRRFRRVLLVVGIALSASLFSLAHAVDGWPGWLIIAVGLIGLLKSVSLLRRTAAEKLFALAERTPPAIIRIGGAVYIVIGLACLYLARTASQ